MVLVDITRVPLRTSTGERDMSEEKVFLTLEEIINPDSPIDVYIEMLDKWVKIRSPNGRDRMEAERDAQLHPGWIRMNDTERDREIGRMLAIRILVEPKLTREQYLDSDDTTIQILLSAVSFAHIDRMSKLSGKRGEAIRSFLEQMLAEGRLNTTNSLKLETTISEKQQKSG